MTIYEINFRFDFGAWPMACISGHIMINELFGIDLLKEAITDKEETTKSFIISLASQIYYLNHFANRSISVYPAHTPQYRKKNFIKILLKNEINILLIVASFVSIVN